LTPYMKHEKFKGSSYEGGYLISDSEIVFARERNGKPTSNINCTVTLTAYRTSQSKN
jgi:hypothetical protein